MKLHFIESYILWWLAYFTQHATSELYPCGSMYLRVLRFAAVSHYTVCLCSKLFIHFIVNKYWGYFKAFAVMNIVLGHRCKVNYKWVEDLNMEGKAIQCLGKNTGDRLHDLWVGKNFSSKTQRAHTVKENNDKLLYSWKWTCWGVAMVCFTRTNI